MSKQQNQTKEAVKIEFSEIKKGDRIRTVYVDETITSAGDYKKVKTIIEFTAADDAKPYLSTQSLVVETENGGSYLGVNGDNSTHYFRLPKPIPVPVNGDILQYENDHRQFFYMEGYFIALPHTYGVPDNIGRVQYARWDNYEDDAKRKFTILPKEEA